MEEREEHGRMGNHKDHVRNDPKDEKNCEMVPWGTADNKEKNANKYGRDEKTTSNEEED